MPSPPRTPPATRVSARRPPIRVRRAGPRRAAATTALLAFVTGCSFAPPPAVPRTVADVPERFQEEPRAAGTYEPVAWWRAYDDPVLDSLVATSLSGNLDLIEAVARLAEARAQFGIARGDLLPGLSGSAGAQRQSSPANTGTFGAISRSGQAPDTASGGAGDPGDGDDPGAPSPPDRFRNITYSASLAASYEVDLWGRVRNGVHAARQDAIAARAALHSARISVVAGVVSTYFDVVDLRRRITLSVAALDVLADRVQATERRYDRGLVASFELYQVRQDYRNTQAGLPVLEAQLADAEGRLAVLLGTWTVQLDDVLPPRLLPRLALDPIPPSPPAALLVQRPDVRAAAHRMEAARYRVGSQRAQLFPSLTLDGSLGVQSDDPGGLLDFVEQWTLGLGASLAAPLFRGGSLRAAVDASEARWAQSAAIFARTLLVAFQEVEVALERYEEQGQRYRFLQAQVDEAEASAQLQARRYASGIGGYVDWLDALRNLYQVRTSLSAAARDVALARLSVHRALGGTWVPDPALPTLDLVAGDALHRREERR